ncbi:hypothetical protein KIN20_033247 [Parelaphostrongylus tenuis]|uniref:Uncharacterized protein n=1 Tax=Parelaphostrongylus tenuis TaxID=148309 RepID=A0AAD5R874_PARTN|nr:hypothetical protein KIN20_033247 [Parelaphostrongylus tenuis]
MARCSPCLCKHLLKTLQPYLQPYLKVNKVFGSVYWDEYLACRDGADYGNATLVCDPSHRLANVTTSKLTDMLKTLQWRIGCECVDGCRRADGRDEFIGLLHVTNSKATDDLKSDMEKEYADAKLGNVTCDNGLLLVYLKDAQKLATYRGGDSFVLLTDEDMEKLHQLASKGQSYDADNTLALQFLLSNYKDVVANPVQTSRIMAANHRSYRCDSYCFVCYRCTVVDVDGKILLLLCETKQRSLSCEHFAIIQNY